MKTVNVVVPPTLRSLSADELKQLAVHTINGRVGKEVLVEVLGGRYDTKRKINTAIANIAQMELAQFYCGLREAGVDINYGGTYFLLSEPLRAFLTIKQG